MNIKTTETSQKGMMFLDGVYESFELNLNSWSKSDYINQWKSAAQHSLDHRAVSALIKNYERPNGNVKKIDIYTIIPEEMTNPLDYIFRSDTQKSFYITESFVFITDDINNIKNDIEFKKIYDAFGEYFPIYYFDESSMSKFYLYLSDRIEGISSWKISERDLKTVLDIGMINNVNSQSSR